MHIENFGYFYCYYYYFDNFLLVYRSKSIFSFVFKEWNHEKINPFLCKINICNIWFYSILIRKFGNDFTSFIYFRIFYIVHGLLMAKWFQLDLLIDLCIFGIQIHEKSCTNFLDIWVLSMMSIFIKLNQSVSWNLLFLDTERQAKGSITITFFVSCPSVLCHTKLQNCPYRALCIIYTVTIYYTVQHSTPTTNQHTHTVQNTHTAKNTPAHPNSPKYTHTLTQPRRTICEGFEARGACAPRFLW